MKTIIKICRHCVYMPIKYIPSSVVGNVRHKLLWTRLRTGQDYECYLNVMMFVAAYSSGHIISLLSLHRIYHTFLLQAQETHDKGGLQTGLTESIISFNHIYFVCMNEPTVNAETTFSRDPEECPIFVYMFPKDNNIVNLKQIMY